MTENIKKIRTLEKFQLFLNKYESVCKKAFEFAGVKLYPAEIHTLEFIRSKGKSFVSEIAKETGITRGAASQMTVKLKKKGLLKSETDPQNKSRLLLKATKRGVDACKAHEEHHLQKDQTFHEFFDSLKDEELENTKELFEMLNLWMDEYL